MGSFQITIAYDPACPDQQWIEVAANIKAAFSACESAQLTLHMLPDSSLALEVALGPECDDVHMKLSLSTPPWRHDP